MKDPSSIKPMEFFETMDKVRRGWFAFMPNQSLKKSYFGILMFIRRTCKNNPDQSGARVSDLAHDMNQTMASISQKINALEQEGLIERIVSESDRRVCYIRLSQKGDELVSKTLAGFEAQVACIFDRFGQEKTVQMIQLLNEFADILQSFRTNPNEYSAKGGCNF